MRERERERERERDRERDVKSFFELLRAPKLINHYVVFVLFLMITSKFKGCRERSSTAKFSNIRYSCNIEYQ